MSVSNKALQSPHCITTDVDEGTPTVAKDPDGRIAQIYKEIAKKVSAKLTQQDEY
jgi:ATP-binding protein involved in chromosome partitioning